MNELKLTSLENSLARLKERIEFYDTVKEKSDVGLIHIARDALIQSFEYTYELSFKTLKRFLKIYTQSNEEIDSMTYSQVIRLALSKNIIEGTSFQKWVEFREARNSTSHAYDEEISVKVSNIVPIFYTSALNLFNRMKDAELD